jgi:hypothetical protein
MIGGLLTKVLGGVAIGLVMLLVAAWFRLQFVENERDRYEAERNEAIAVAEANEATIETLLAETERLDNLLLRADEREREIRQDARRNRQALQSVAEDNPDVEDFLGQLIPGPLRELLNTPPVDADGDGEGDAAQVPDNPL